MEIFRKHNIEMVSHTESFDTNTPMGRAMVGLIGILAQWEREVIGERIAFALNERAHQGKRTTSFVLGYDRLGKDSFVVNAREAQYVRFCFDNYLVYKNLSRLSRLCDAHGYRGKRGKSPSTATIRTILTNPIYCGYNSFKGEIIKGTHEPIISIETYNEVQRALISQGKNIRHKKPIKIIAESA